MPQATFKQDEGVYDYTPVADVAAGAVVVVGNVVMISKRAIPALTLGALSACGLFLVAKDASVFAAGDQVFWDPAGNPVGGTAGTGAATSNGPYYLGIVPPNGAALTGDATVQVAVDSERRTGQPTISTVAAAGSVQADAAQLADGFTLVTGADGTKGVKLPTAVAGRRVEVKNGTNAVLKIWPATADGINAIAVNSAFSIPALTSVILTAYDATTWYSTPLLPS